jgi:hypothetical protein
MFHSSAKLVLIVFGQLCCRPSHRWLPCRCELAVHIRSTHRRGSDCYAHHFLRYEE